MRDTSEALRAMVGQELRVLDADQVPHRQRRDTAYGSTKVVYPTTWGHADDSFLGIN